MPVRRSLIRLEILEQYLLVIVLGVVIAALSLMFKYWVLIFATLYLVSIIPALGISLGIYGPRRDAVALGLVAATAVTVGLITYFTDTVGLPSSELIVRQLNLSLPLYLHCLLLVPAAVWFILRLPLTRDSSAQYRGTTSRACHILSLCRVSDAEEKLKLRLLLVGLLLIGFITSLPVAFYYYNRFGIGLCCPQQLLATLWVLSITIQAVLLFWVLIDLRRISRSARLTRPPGWAS